MKHRIITELYNSNILQEKIKGSCFRNSIDKGTLIHEDVVQETFMWLSRKSSDEILSMYYNDGKEPKGSLKRLIGLGVRILNWKGFAKNSRDPDYPKHSLSGYILFTSNLKKLSSLNPTEYADQDDHTGLVLRSTLDEENPDEVLWSKIRGELSEEENEQLDFFLSPKKKKGYYSNEKKEQYQHLLERIEYIITEKLKIRI